MFVTLLNDTSDERTKFDRWSR